VKRFRFRLETLRELREHAEREAKEDLARELAAAERCAAAVDEAEARLAAARVEASTAAGAALTGEELRARRAFVDRRNEERLRALADAEAQSQRVLSSIASLEQAARERETLERAKSRARDLHEREQARVEATTLDEVAMLHHFRMQEAR
jgi:flagellar export protein FliJ